MKTKKILLLLLLTTIFISCKDDKKTEESVAEVQKALTFDVTVDLIIKKDDELILFYKDNSISYFDAKNTVYFGVKGSERILGGFLSNYSYLLQNIGLK